MKIRPFVFGLCCGLSVSVLTASVSQFEKTTPSCEAMVERIDGYYIFADSRPLRDYEVIGTVKTGFFYLQHDGYPTVRNNLIAKARRHFGNADGLILNWDTKGSVGAADVIRFKR